MHQGSAALEFLGTKKSPKILDSDLSSDLSSASGIAHNKHCLRTLHFCLLITSRITIHLSLTHPHGRRAQKPNEKIQNICASGFSTAQVTRESSQLPAHGCPRLDMKLLAFLACLLQQELSSHCCTISCKKTSA